MDTQTDRIHITAVHDEVRIVIRGDAGDISFDATSPRLGTETDRPPEPPVVELLDEQEEYVITFEFHDVQRHDGRGTSLKRLDAHVRNVVVHWWDDGYALEGELSGWVGYTDAFRAPVD